MTFRVRLKKASKPKQPRLKFDLQTLRDPDVAFTFQVKTGGNFAPLNVCTTYNTGVKGTLQEKAMVHQRCS